MNSKQSERLGSDFQLHSFLSDVTLSVTEEDKKKKRNKKQKRHPNQSKIASGESLQFCIYWCLYN